MTGGAGADGRGGSGGRTFGADPIEMSCQGEAVLTGGTGAEGRGGSGGGILAGRVGGRGMSHQAGWIVVWQAAPVQKVVADPVGHPGWGYQEAGM